jgi:hypothetical protein
LALPASASASNSIALAPSPANPDDSAPYSVNVIVVADQVAWVWLTVKHVAGGSCAADPRQDGGTVQIQEYGIAAGEYGTGTAGAQPALAASGLGGLPGQDLICAWLTDGPDPSVPSSPITVYASTSTTVAVSAKDTLSLYQSDPDPVVGRSLSIGAAGTVYVADASVTVTSKPAAGGTCAAAPAADTGKVEVTGFPAGSAGQPFQLDAIVDASPLALDGHLYCGWLLGPHREVLAAARTTVTARAARVSVRIAGLPARGYTLGKYHFDVTSDWGVPLILHYALLHPAGSCAAAVAHQDRYYTIQLTVARRPGGTVSESPGGLAIPGSLVVCAWMTGAWDGAPATALLAGPVSASETVLASVVTYGGRSSQRLPISIGFDRADGLLTGMQYKLRYRCPARVYFPGSAMIYWNGELGPFQLQFSSVRADRRGRFAVNLNGNPSDRLKLSGRIAGNTLTGSLIATGRSRALIGPSHPNLVCTTGLVRFTLKLGRS